MTWCSLLLGVFINFSHRWLAYKLRRHATTLRQIKIVEDGFSRYLYYVVEFRAKNNIKYPGYMWHILCGTLFLFFYLFKRSYV